MKFVYRVYQDIEVEATNDEEALKKLSEITSQKVRELRGVYDDEGNKLEYAYQMGKKVYYLPTCPCGYNDCISDPAYIRNHYPDWWQELGCPTKCTSCEKLSDGTYVCDYYDDEDK